MFSPGGPDPDASEKFERVFEQVYEQLKSIAHQQMLQERSAHTMRATELVHQAYLRLFGSGDVRFVNHGHLVHAAAEAMRRILIEYARQRSRLKRGGDRQRLPLSAVDVSLEQAPLPEDSDQLLALDDALRRLEEKDPRAGEVVRLRFYAGLTIDQTAEALALSPRTVRREWEFAQAWLSQALK